MLSWICSSLALVPGGTPHSTGTLLGLQTGVARHGAGWIAEIAIPWKSLAGAGVSAAPKAGDQWRAGLYRIKRPGGPAKVDQIAALVAEDEDREYGAERTDRDEAERAARG